MSRNITVGWERSRPQALISVQLLKDAGVNAWCELGMVSSEFADSSSARIYVPEDNLDQEAIKVIREVLGPNADEETLAHFESLSSESATVARFESRDEATAYADMLRGRGVPVRIEGENLVISADELNPQTARLIVDYLGDLAEPVVRAMAR